MSTVLSSVSEITRVGGWALRGIGYPFGVAERGTHLLAWTEAVGGQAIRSLRLLEAAIEKSHSADRCQRTGDPASGRIVQARGRHLLEIGAPAIDLVTHDARHNSVGHIAVEGVFGLVFLPALAALLVRRKLCGVLSYRAAEGDLLPEGIPAAGWLLVRSDSDGAEYVHGYLDGTSEDVVGRALARAERFVSARLLDRVFDDMRAAAAAGPLGRMGVLAMPDVHSLANPLLGSNRPIPEGIRSIDFAGRFADALANGVPIEAEDLDYLYGLEIRTWAPTSERSRLQAGYGVY